MRSPARRLFVSILAAAFTLTSMAGVAEAKARHKHTGGASRLSSFLHFTSQPKYAAIVVDAKSGEVLYQQAPDDHRYPASLTKIMTMYLASMASRTAMVWPGRSPTLDGAWAAACGETMSLSSNDS